MIDLKDLKERVSSLQKQYNDILTERANLESSIQDSKSRLDKLRQTRTDYNQALSRISRNPVTRDQEKTALDAKYNISDVTTEIENIEKSIETNLAQKRVLDTSEKSLNDEYAKLYSSFIQIIDQEQRTISERFTSYQNDKSEIQSLSQIEAERDTLQSSINDLVIQKQNMGIDPDSEMFSRAQQDLDKKISEANEQMSKLLERRDSIISLQAKNNDIDPKLMEQEWDQLETLKSTLKNPNIKSSKTKSKGRKRNNPNQFELGKILDEILEEINQIDPSIKTSSEELAEQVAKEAKKAEEIAARKKAEEEARKNAEEEARKNAEEEARKKAEEEETFLDDFDSYQSTKSTPSPTLEELWKRDEELYSTYEAEEEEAKKIAEEEAARIKAEEEAARKKAEEEAARKKAEEEAARKKAEEEAARKKAEEKAAEITNQYGMIYNTYFSNSEKLNKLNKDTVIQQVLALSISDECKNRIDKISKSDTEETLVNCIKMAFPSSIPDFPENLSFSVHLQDLTTIIGKLDELVAEQEKKDLEKEFNAALKEASTKTTYTPEEQILSDYNNIRNSFTSGQYNQLDTATISKLLSELPNFKQYYQKFSNLMNDDEHPDRLVSSAIKFSFPLLTLSDPPLDILTHLRNIRAIQTKLDELVAEQENSEQQGAEEGAFPSSEKLQNQITNLKNQISPINTKPRPIEETKPVDNDYPDFGPFDRVDNGFGIPDGSYPDFTSLFNETPDEEEDPYENELDDDEHDDDEQQKDAFYDIYNDPKFSYLLDEEEDPYENEHDDDEELDDNYFDPEFLNLFGTPPDDNEHDDEELDDDEHDDEELDDDEHDDEELEDDEIEDDEIEDADFEEDKKPRFLHKIGNAIHNGFSSFLRIITMKDTPQLGAGDDEYDEYDDEYDDADKYPTKAAQRKEMTAGIHEDTPVLSHEFFENNNSNASRDSRNSTDPRDPE